MPHLLRLFGLLEIELFRQDGLAARAMFDADLRHIRSSLLMEVQFLRIEVLGQRARCGLAAAAAEPWARRSYLAETRRCARALARIGSPWSIAYATPLQAELALIDGNPAESIALLKTAVARYDEFDMNLRAAAAAYRLGEVVGGGEGGARMLGVTNPGAIAGGFMPSMR